MNKEYFDEIASVYWSVTGTDWIFGGSQRQGRQMIAGMSSRLYSVWQEIFINSSSNFAHYFVFENDFKRQINAGILCRKVNYINIDSYFKLLQVHRQN